MTAMLGLTSLKSPTTNSINCSPTTNVKVITGGVTRELTEKECEGTTSPAACAAPQVQVVYPDEKFNPYANLTPREILSVANENEALKLIVQIMQTNPLMVNKYIIADDEILKKLVQLLTCSDDVQIDAEDIFNGCCTQNTYRKINAIYVTIGGETKNLKYDFPRVTKELNELKISTKFVF